MKETNEEKIREWRLLIEERERNKLTITEFCQQKSISASKYYYYQDLIKYPEKLKQKRDRDKVRKRSNQNIQPIKIINSLVQNEQSHIKLNLPNSVQCIFPRDMPVNEMKMIVEMLLSC